jgi:hypothetical protein
VTQIQDDILMITGGHFHPASVGPEAYQEKIDQVRTQPDVYLDAFEAMFLGANFDALNQSKLYLHLFLRRLIDLRPERVKALTGQLLRQYEGVLVVYDSVNDKQALFNLVPQDKINLFNRLDEKRDELQKLLQEVE